MADLIAELEGVVRLQKEFDEARGYRAGCDAMDAEEDAAVNFLRTHHAEIAAAVRDAARFAPCLWVPDDDTDSWDTACGNKHQFIAGDAADNLYQHCPYCGGKLIEPNYDTAMRAGEGEG